MDPNTPDEKLRRAYHTRIRRHTVAQWRMADSVAEAERREREHRDWADRRIADLEAENAVLRSEVAGKDRELQTIMNTKTFRYTAALRRFYGWLRGRR